MLAVVEELQEVLLHRQDMAEVELECLEIVPQDHLLVVEMDLVQQAHLDLKIPAAEAAEVKEVQHLPISSIWAETADPVLSSSHTTPNK